MSRIIPICIYGETAKINTFAFLDEGSLATLLNEKIHKVLNLKREMQPSTLKDSFKRTLTIPSKQGGKKFNGYLDTIHSEKRVLDGPYKVHGQQTPDVSQ